MCWGRLPFHGARNISSTLLNSVSVLSSFPECDLGFVRNKKKRMWKGLNFYRALGRSFLNNLQQAEEVDNIWPFWSCSFREHEERIREDRKEGTWREIQSKHRRSTHGVCLSCPSLLTIYFWEAEGEAGANEEFSGSAKAYKLAAETTSFAGVSKVISHAKSHRQRWWTST